MINIKTHEEIETMKKGGKRHAFILSELKKMVVPGLSTQALEDRARELLSEEGDKGAFLNYTPRGSKRPYPAVLNVSINNEIVHGIPNENPRILQDGDVVSIDLGVLHQGLITDSAITVGVGNILDEDKKMLAHCEEALFRAIKQARGGNTVGDISHAIESFVRPLGYGIPEGLAGHGVGYKVHEDPYVPNEGPAHHGELLQPGMIIAIEPMITLGASKIVLAKDGYTYKTADGSNAAHFEHTVAITDGDPIILTK